MRRYVGALRSAGYSEAEVLDDLKIANTARDQWLLRKMATFIREANLGRVTVEERANVLEYFQQDEKTQKEELSFLILILDRYLEEDKAAWLARVYVEFVKGNTLGLMQRISRIITETSSEEHAQIQSGIAILPYENGGVFKYTSLGLKLKSILFPKISLYDGLIELDYSQTISMV